MEVGLTFGSRHESLVYLDSQISGKDYLYPGRSLLAHPIANSGITDAISHISCGARYFKPARILPARSDRLPYTPVLHMLPAAMSVLVLVAAIA